MWGSFAASKSKALEATNVEYGDGGFEMLTGGSHASGNDIDLGISKGKRRRAEGGEGLAIFSRKSIQKYGSLIPNIVDQINAGRFTQDNMPAIITDSQTQYDFSNMDDNIDRIAANSEHTRYTDADGSTVVVYHNLKTIYNG